MTQLTHKQNSPTRHRQHGPASTSAIRPIMSHRATAVSGAADRFMARPEISETIYQGSNGYSARLPASLDARMALWKKWPEADRCAALARAIDAELDVTADAEHVQDAVAAMLASFPTGDRAAAGYREGLVSFIIGEADVRGWSAAAVGRGCVSIIRTSRFQPAAAEVIDAITEAQRELRHASWAARQAVELSYDLRWSLQDAGLIEVEDDGGAF